MGLPEGMLVRKAEVINVVCVTCVGGSGTEKDPARHVYQYYLPNGVKVGEIDSRYVDLNSGKVLSDTSSANMR